MTTRRVMLAAATWSVLGSISATWAAESERSDDAVKLADVTGHLDLSIPQSPAFSILGVTPETVVRSDDLRVVAAALLHGLDPQGNLQRGIAIDVRPYLALAGDESTLGDYQSSRFVQIASTLQLSFATASGQSDSDKADRQAIAVNIKLWREHDPALGRARIKYQRIAGANVPRREVDESNLVDGTIGGCYGDYLTAATETVAAEFPSDEDMSKAEEALAAGARKSIEACLKPFKSRYWNAGSVEFAIAGYRSDVEGVSDDGFGAWLGFSHSLGKHGQVILRTSYADNRLVAPRNASPAYRLIDETDAGARLRFGSSKGTMMIEGLWTRAKSATIDEEYWRASIGAELLVLPDIWIQLAVGKAFSTELFDDDPVYSGQLRFGFSEHSLISRE